MSPVVLILVTLLIVTLVGGWISRRSPYWWAPFAIVVAITLIMMLLGLVS